jgi:hypothetical protein
MLTRLLQMLVLIAGLVLTGIGAAVACPDHNRAQDGAAAVMSHDAVATDAADASGPGQTGAHDSDASAHMVQGGHHMASHQTADAGPGSTPGHGHCAASCACVGVCTCNGQTAVMAATGPEAPKRKLAAKSPAGELVLPGSPGARLAAFDGHEPRRPWASAGSSPARSVRLPAQRRVQGIARLTI